MAVRRAAVIGAGPMGLWLAKHLSRKGFAVKVFDKNTKLLKSLGIGRRILPARSLTEAVGDAEIVMLAVGAKNAAALVRRIVQRFQGKTLVDVSAVKTPVAKALKRINLRNNTVVLLHPLFGPGVRNLEDKTVVLAVYRNRRAEYRMCRELFSPSKVLVMSPREHDLKMAASMALTRILLLALFETWRKKRVEDLVFSQKAVRLAASTILTESSSLTSEIIAQNPYTAKLIQETFKTIQSVKTNPSKAVETIRKRVSKNLLTKSYLEIYRLVEKLEVKNK